MAERDQQTEKPTQRKLQKARTEGQFPVSKEFTGGVQFLVFVWLLGSYGSAWLASLAVTAGYVIDRGFHGELTPATLRELLSLMTTRLAFPMMLAGATLVGVGLTSHLLVTRLGFSFQKLSPDFSRLNPARNLSNVKRQNLTHFVQALILMPLFSLAVYAVAKDNLPLFLQLPFQAAASGVKEGDFVDRRSAMEGSLRFPVLGLDRPVPPATPLRAGHAHEQTGSERRIEGVRR